MAESQAVVGAALGGFQKEQLPRWEGSWGSGPSSWPSSSSCKSSEAARAVPRAACSSGESTGGEAWLPAGPASRGCCLHKPRSFAAGRTVGPLAPISILAGCRWWTPSGSRRQFNERVIHKGRVCGRKPEVSVVLGDENSGMSLTLGLRVKRTRTEVFLGSQNRAITWRGTLDRS